jgi:hypothetical protein
MNFIARLPGRLPVSFQDDWESTVAMVRTAFSSYDRNDIGVEAIVNQAKYNKA